MSLAMALLAMLIGLGILVSKLVESWLRHKCHRRLPPGTMGWPMLGETLHFFSQDPAAFFQGKQKRYGEIFKTHVLGCPAIMVANPEAIKFVLTNDQLFKTTFPTSKERLLGRQALFFHTGDYHLTIRRLALSAFRPELLRHSLPDVEALALKALASMDSSQASCSGSEEPVIAFKQLKDFTFDVAALLVLGPHVRDQYRQQLKDTYYQLDAGYNSFPLNVPGTKFYKSMQARRRVQEILASIIADQEKDKTAARQEGSFLAVLMDHWECDKNDGSSQERLTREQIIDNALGMVFAAHGTTAAVMTWMLKYLADHPAVLQAVVAEQEGIIKNKVEGQTGLTLLDTKNAPFTAMVIQETLRAASVLSFTYREAVQDVEYKGYIIPRGWKVLPLFRNMHHNPALFPNPHKFDPARFESAPKANAFIPFGRGVHACLGTEVAKLEMHIFIHHLTTKYRWVPLPTAGGVTYSPFLLPKDGLPVTIFHKAPPASITTLCAEDGVMPAAGLPINQSTASPQSDLLTSFA